MVPNIWSYTIYIWHSKLIISLISATYAWANNTTKKSNLLVLNYVEHNNDMPQLAKIKINHISL